MWPSVPGGGGKDGGRSICLYIFSSLCHTPLKSGHWICLSQMKGRWLRGNARTRWRQKRDAGPKSPLCSPLFCLRPGNSVGFIVFGREVPGWGATKTPKLVRLRKARCQMDGPCSGPGCGRGRGLGWRGECSRPSPILKMALGVDTAQGRGCARSLLEPLWQRC